MNTQASITIRIPSFLNRLWINRRRLGRTLTRHLIPNIGSVVLVLVLLWVTGAHAAPYYSRDNAPNWPNITTINYQGRLADSSGTPLDGNYGMSFSFYDSDTGGSLLWGPENHLAVPVSNGLFSVGLGSQTPGGVPTSILTGDIWLEITVAGETLSPRERLSTVPYAMQASTALTVPDGTITNQKLALSYWRASPSGDVRITSTDPDSRDLVISVDVDFPVDGVYLIFAKVISQSDDANKMLIAKIYDENGPIGESQIVATHPVGGLNGRVTSTTATAATFSAGSHTIKLMANMYTGTAGHVKQGTELIIVPFGQP